MKIRPWLQFFRLPNLPTAPGDALAGAAFLLQDGAGGFAQAVAAGAAALGLYMFGLADNDIVGVDADAKDRPDRPLARGDISMCAARVARALCLVGAVAAGACALLPPAWWVAAAVLAGTVVTYNRTKFKWLMGLCRGLSVTCGAFAVWEPTWQGNGKWMVAALAAGWTMYITAVTWLSEGEETESEGLGKSVTLWGLSACVPLLACMFVPEEQVILPAVGSLFAIFAWIVATVPVVGPHGPAERRRAVGQAIGALLYLQIGYMLVMPRREFFVLAVALWLAARLVRRVAPDISGS